MLTFAFVAWSLWLLGVRDWRCYPVALLWPFTREAVEYGAIGPLLLLIVAFLWRYRDSTWGAATATASAVAAKLFLWPLARVARVHGQDPDGRPVDRRRARCSCSFRGSRSGSPDSRQYPALLQEVADSGRITRSYSVIALVRSLGGSSELAKVLSLLLGAALLALAFRAARNHAMTARDRDRISLGYVLAAALVLTPVVWPHYLVLLARPARAGATATVGALAVRARRDGPRTHSTGTGRHRKASGDRWSSSPCSSRSSSSGRSRPSGPKSVAK